MTTVRNAGVIRSKFQVAANHNRNSAHISVLKLYKRL